ncbi:uncharacterized protein LOC110032247 isoform X2 [Phalaenopsis equestris]|uniref:uncharacterized protein LOC110032247 isoform X2 n=2 Tax=Phalaenopsis equestris TaxID=78828 RepID=UPI0009E4CBDC|nr:uncharacterized protein LOC110032247 isoform X2 [Phalaenopsis equestris]
MPPPTDEDDTQIIVSSGGDAVFIGGETLPLEYGETQRVDSCGEQLGEEVEDWGKTQVVDDFEETEVVGDDDEDGGGLSERTELVDDEEGLVDDFVGEVESGLRSKDAGLVDPDASTDEEERCDDDEPECSRKNFDACIPTGKKLESSNLAEGNFNTHNHEKTEESPTRMKTSWMETMPSSASALNIVVTKRDESVLDRDAENSFKFIRGYNRDNYLYQEEETEIRSKLNKEKMASQSPLRCSETAAGLSYISSQEPGLQSQTIALGVVDKFLSVHNEELSSDINNENADTVISLPIASVKKAQCFVRKTDKSTTGKVQVYDWIDSLEDEGGGELFSRRKDSFFGCKQSKRVSHRLVGSDNKSSAEGAKSKTCQKLASLSKSKKYLFSELMEQTNTDTMEQLKKFDVPISDEGVYSCGPATQMAAEAMQALGHSSPVSFEPTTVQSRHGEDTRSSTQIIKASRTRSRNASARKRSNKSEGIMTPSKLQNISKSRKKCCNSSRKQSTKSRKEIVLKDGTAEITAKMIINCEEMISAYSGDYEISTGWERMKHMVDKKVEKSPVPVLSKQPSVGEKRTLGTSELYTSPVAHRTRRSKAAEHLSLNQILFTNACNDTSRINLRTHRPVEMEDESVSNTSVVPKVNKNGCIISLSGTMNYDHGFNALPVVVEVERGHNEETVASRDRDVYRESKRRKMKNIDKENQTSDRRPAIQKKGRKVFIRSFAEILDTVKRRKRSVSLSSKFESDGMQNESGIRTRSSLLSDILKPYVANNSHSMAQLSCKPASDGTANTNSLSSVKRNVNNDKLETSKKSAQSRLLAEVVNQDTKPEGSTVAICQSGLQCSPITGKNAVSPLSRSPISRELIRLETSYTSPSKLNDVRRRKDMACFHVCFSNHLNKDVIKQQEKILKRLGIQEVSSSLEATHFVADRFVRTRNMLEAMAMGKPVVTPMWLESCGQASSSIDEKNYILRDSRKEKEIGFSMPVSLARACELPLLQGKRVYVTRNARPNQELISSLVKVAGGQALKRIELSITEDDKLPDNLLILSGEEDFAVCAPLLKKGAVVFSSELLLNGIVIQKLEYERHQLFLNQVKRTH